MTEHTEQPERFDRIVVGGGAMGLATTWQLASRGLRVLMLERFTPGHHRGASHGATRNMNNAYAEDHYLDLYDEALQLWRLLEASSGRQLLTLGGLVTHGDPERVRAAHDSLVARGATVELIDPAEAEARWPGMRFEGAVLVNRDAGRIHAAEALEVLGALSRDLGADLRYEHRVLAIEPGEDRVRVTVIAETAEGSAAESTTGAPAGSSATGSGTSGSSAAGSSAAGSSATGSETAGSGTAGSDASELEAAELEAAGSGLPAPEAGSKTVTFEAEGVVVTAGAWAAPLLDGLVDLPPLRVTEEHPAHFAIRPEFATAAWPSFNHFRPSERLTGYAGNVYGMLTPGEGVKVGFHATGDEVDPDRRRFRAPDAARAQLREHVARWFPGVDPDSAVEISCTYTLTESERFVLDTRGRITVGAGFSGQGFKFVPAIGRVLADATLGAARPPESFRLESHGA